ncbi:MAG: hypothetical protein EOP45_21275, partial [Sphingobacteriaceae bacterium]
MHSLLQNLGGHEQFTAYQKWFRSLYCDPNRVVKDVLNRRVTFDMYPSLDDTAHVCYGGKDDHAYKAEYWVQERAERIAWIEVALTNPNFIHPDKWMSTN